MGKTVKLDREFNSTAQKIWEAWTNPEIIAKWWAPEGLSNYHASVDLKVGGEFRYCMVSPDGTEYWGKGTYTEIKEPNKLVYIDTFTDPEGNPVPPSYYGNGGDEVWESELVLEINQVSPGKVKVTLTMEAYTDSNVQEMTMTGWNSMLDKLDKAVTS